MLQSILQPILRPILQPIVGGVRRGGAAAFSPLSLSPYSYWDVSDLSAMWQDSAGTTPAAVDSPVGRLDDKSGNGRHFSQSTSAARPILRLASGKYYLEFDGVDDYMENLTFNFNAAALYAIAGLRAPNPALANERIYSLAAVNSADFNTSTGAALISRLGSAAALEINRNGIQGSVAIAPSELAVIEVGTTSIYAQAAKNGGADATTASNVQPDLNSAALYLMRYSGGGIFSTARYFGGVIMDRIPTAGERANLVAWVNSRTGAF